MCAICDFKIELGVGQPPALTIAVAIVTSQVAMQAWLDGEMDIERMSTESLLFIDGPFAQRENLLSMLVESTTLAMMNGTRETF